MWTNFLFGGTAALFIAQAIVAIRQLRWVQRLPGLDSLSAGGGSSAPLAKPVRCSVVIAARDEAARIEQTIRQLFAQRDVDLDVIVVDDRSTDGTTEILERLAREESRLHIKRVDVLPEQWLGKCHACHVGALAATGEWILFTDADCWLKPDVIARALRVAQRDGADHVTIAPGMVVKSFGAKTWHLLFLVAMVNWIAGVNRNLPKSFLGIGAFNLVRAEAYRQCGGYKALHLTVVDDIKLGLLLRRAGRRTRAFLGADDVECRWGTTVWEMVKLMEKNYFPALDYRLAIVSAGSVFVLALFVCLILGLLSGTPIGLAAVLSPFLIAWPATVLSRRLKQPVACALCLPFMYPVFLVALWNSTIMALTRRGIRWRDTFYPLSLLRSRNVQ